MLSHRRLAFAMTLVGLISLNACADFRVKDLDPNKLFTPHYLLVHADGYALNSQLKGLTTAELEERLERRLFPGIQKHIEAVREADLKDCGDRLRLLIFIHGGMNSYSDSFERMTNMMVVKDRVHPFPLTCYYPMFVNWNSGFGSSVGDDLFRMRFGRPDRWVGGITSPLVLPVRLAGSIARLPFSIGHNFDTIGEAWQGADEQMDPWYCRSGDLALYAPLQPVYFVTIPLLEGFGRPAWDIMKRRAQLAVSSRLVDGPEKKDAYVAQGIQTYNQFRDNAIRQLTQQTGRKEEGKAPETGEGAKAAPVERIEPPDAFTEGAVRTLAQSLKNRIIFDPTRKQWIWARLSDNETERAKAMQVEITLVGHSMGSILLNRMLIDLDREALAKRAAIPFPIKDIVYMAPAASINELEDFMIPYLQYNPRAKFSLFALNRRDETREIPLDGWAFIMPRGSLLAWIDAFLESESTYGQATSGRMRNLGQYYGLKETPEAPRRRGTNNCFKPTWKGEGPAPEKKPVNTLFRKLTVQTPPTTKELQDYNRFVIYESPGRVADETVPLEHGDFTKGQFFLEVLCHVDMGAFRDKSVCTKPPFWLDENSESTWVPLFNRE